MGGLLEVKHAFRRMVGVRQLQAVLPATIRRGDLFGSLHHFRELNVEKRHDGDPFDCSLDGNGRGTA
jgi:hypothetical protein